MIWWVWGCKVWGVVIVQLLPSVKSSTCNLCWNFTKAQHWSAALIKWLACLLSPRLYTSGDEWMTAEYFYELNLKHGSYPEGDAGIRLAEKPHLAKGYFRSDFTWWNVISDLLFRFTYSSSLRVGAVYWLKFSLHSVIQRHKYHI